MLRAKNRFSLISVNHYLFSAVFETFQTLKTILEGQKRHFWGPWTFGVSLNYQNWRVLDGISIFFGYFWRFLSIKKLNFVSEFFELSDLFFIFMNFRTDSYERFTQFFVNSRRYIDCKLRFFWFFGLFFSNFINFHYFSTPEGQIRRKKVGNTHKNIPAVWKPEEKLQNLIKIQKYFCIFFWKKNRQK